MKHIKKFESYNINYSDNNKGYNYYFNTPTLEYKISISEYNDGYWSIGFKAKKEDDYFYNHEIIANENPYKIMDTVVKVAKDFYFKKVKEIEDIKKLYNIKDNPYDIIKGFIFSFSGDKEKNLQRLNLYKRYFDKFGLNIEFFNKDNIYYLKMNQT